jgi:hypothetical protein
MGLLGSWAHGVACVVMWHFQPLSTGSYKICMRRMSADGRAASPPPSFLLAISSAPETLWPCSRRSSRWAFLS